jgi:Bacteriophage replication gene A protein (GPA)
VLYVPADQLDTVKKIIGKIWLRDYADEPGAQQHRVRFTDEDPAKGSGVGYLAKYVAKNIDGAGSIGAEASDESGRPVSEDAQHAVAWSRIHGIRQFQQLGGPAVTLWRELRRVREPCEWPPLEALRLCTDYSQAAGEPGGTDARPDVSGPGNSATDPSPPATPSKTLEGETSVTGPSWSRFIETLGGIGASLKASRALFDKAEPRRIDREGRKGLRLTRWGELPLPMIVGVQLVYRDRIRRLATRVHVWFLIFAPCRGASDLGPVAITVLGAAVLGSPAAWTNPQETSQAPPYRCRDSLCPVCQ